MKTNFSFEIQQRAEGATAAGSQVMAGLQPALEKLLAAADASATVSISDSRKGPDNKLVELTSTLGDEPLQKLLAGFSSEHGLVINPLE